MKKTCISKNWLIAGFGSQSYRPVDLPYDYVVGNGRAAGGGSYAPCNGYFRSSKARYVKHLRPDEAPAADHYILHIDGAYMFTQVYFNENIVATHPHGYTPFLIDLSEDMIVGGVNKIAVETDPMMPSTRWYAGGGLYRDVFLWTGGRVRIEPWDCFITTPAADEKSGTVNAHYDVASDLDTTATVKATVLDADGTTVSSGELTLKVKAGEKTPCDIMLSVREPALWCCENPYLYTLHTEIAVDGEILDTADENFGIRTFTMDAKNGFLLNGKPVKMRGGCIHHDHGVLGAAAFPAAEARKVRLLKQAGFNALRISHNPPSLALLEICDREGIILMDEAFDHWTVENTLHDYHLWFADWYERDIASMVMRDRNHPCVFSYSIGNEIIERDGSSFGARWSRILSDTVRKYDTTRPVTSALCGIPRTKRESIDGDDYAMQDVIRYRQRDKDDPAPMETWCDRTEPYCAPLDIVGYNYRYAQYEHDHERYPDRVMWGSETWALHFFDDWAVTLRSPYVLGNFTWTAYDNLGEAGTGRFIWTRDGKTDLGCTMADYPWRSCYQGDLDLCGYRRPQSYFREAVWLGGTEPRIFTTHPEHIGENFGGTGWHWYDVHETWTFDEQYLGQPVKCDVYTDADEIVFTLNGREVGKASPVKGIATLDIPYERGTLTATAYKGGKCVGTHTLETTAAPAKIAVTPERESIAADRRDLAYFQITITDKEGRHVPESRTELTCSVTGGELLGTFSGDPCNEDVYGSNKCHTFEGRALAIVRTAEAGTVTLTVTAEELTEGTASVAAK